MIQGEEFNAFCREHYKEAMKYADMAVASHVKTHGPNDRRMDIDKVKSLAVISSLENAFLTFDPTRNTKLSTYLSFLVHNDVKSELDKEWTALRKFDLIETKRKARKTAEEKEAEAKAKESGERPEEHVSSIMPGVKATGEDMKLFEPAEFMDVYGSNKGKEKLIRDMMRKLQQLPPMDQLVLRYWMNEEHDDRAYEVDGEKPTRTYVQRVIDELGLDDSASNAITLRCFKAKKKLAALMKGVKTDYHDIYIPGSSQWKGYTGNSRTVVKIYSDSEYEEIGKAFCKKVFE